MNSIGAENLVGGIIKTKETKAFAKKAKSLLKSGAAATLNGLKRLWKYLEEQNELAIEHHKAIQRNREEFFEKNWHHIRGGF